MDTGHPYYSTLKFLADRYEDDKFVEVKELIELWKAEGVYDSGSVHILMQLWSDGSVNLIPEPKGWDNDSTMPTHVQIRYDGMFEAYGNPESELSESPDAYLLKQNSN